MRYALDKCSLDTGLPLSRDGDASIMSPNSRRNADRSIELRRLLSEQANSSGEVTVGGLKTTLESVAMPLNNKTLEVLSKNFGVKRTPSGSSSDYAPVSTYGQSMCLDIVR